MKTTTFVPTGDLSPTGYLETLVAEGRWQSELSKLDLQFLYQVMNDAAIQMDYRYATCR